MIISKQRLIELSASTGFIKDNLEKVLRLSEILKFFNEDQFFNERLALKGGTAINLTIFDLPRLSVDIDLDYSLDVSKEEMANEKEVISSKVIRFMEREGYELVTNSRMHYALLSFIFSYINNAGNKDKIKIEINVMDRCHIMPIEKRPIMPKYLEGAQCYTVSINDLFASKVNALLSRAAPRDLYDVASMIDANVIKDKTLFKKCVIFYNMIGGEQDIIDLDFKNIESIDYHKVMMQLKPLLSKIEKFSLEQTKEKVINYLKELLVLDESEKEFVNEFKNKKYNPRLLFNDDAIIKNIEHHPMALWRCMEK